LIASDDFNTSLLLLTRLSHPASEFGGLSLSAPFGASRAPAGTLAHPRTVALDEPSPIRASAGHRRTEVGGGSKPFTASRAISKPAVTHAASPWFSRTSGLTGGKSAYSFTDSEQGAAAGEDGQQETASPLLPILLGLLALLVAIAIVVWFLRRRQYAYESYSTTMEINIEASEPNSLNFLSANGEYVNQLSDGLATFEPGVHEEAFDE
jgi:hypothetical protein